jgi:hypothetical protein
MKINMIIGISMQDDSASSSLPVSLVVEVKMCGCSHTILKIRYTRPRWYTTNCSFLLSFFFWHHGKHIMNNYSVIKCLALRPHYMLWCRQGFLFRLSVPNRGESFENKLAHRASYRIFKRDWIVENADRKKRIVKGVFEELRGLLN